VLCGFLVNVAEKNIRKRIIGLCVINAAIVFALTVCDYDIVIGPIADDRVGVQLYRFLQGDIDIETLVKRLKYMKG
jgi:hypothetical protein